MGVDITLNIVSKDGKYIHEDIFDGRNSEWFGNISGNYNSEFYQNYPLRNGIPDAAPDDIKRFYNDPDFGYYDFFYVNVGEFCEWFQEARPDIDAGWVSTYDQWLYEKKKIVPDYTHSLGEDDNPYDYHFIEIENPWDCSKWLYDFIVEHTDISPDDFIIYYFDC